MTRPERWMDVLNQHLTGRKELVDRIRTGLGISQGTGAVKMIDAARAVPLLEKAAANWSWDMPASKVPEWVKPAVRRFPSWSVVVDDQLKALQALLREIRVRQPRGVAGKNTLASIRTALDRAREVSLSLPTHRARNLEDLLARASTVDWSLISTLEDKLGKTLDTERSKAPRLASAIRTAAQDRGRSLEVIRDLLCEADEWLDEALKGAEIRASSSAAKNAADGVQELLADWQSLVIEGVEVQ